MSPPHPTSSSTSPPSTSRDPMEKRCAITDLNEMITCKICRGYLIDATTVTECLHTFCKSCIVKHLEEDKSCPECDDLIHQSHPLDYIAFDRTMQDLVAKIVPNLERDEMERERSFYAQRNLPWPREQQMLLQQQREAANNKDTLESNKTENSKENGTKGSENNKTQSENGNNSSSSALPSTFSNGDSATDSNEYHRKDEQVSLLLETPTTSSSSHPSSLRRRFVRCSSLATVTHLKKYIAKRLLDSIERHKDLEIRCNDEPLYKDHTLKFVYVTRWRTKQPPMRLQFGLLANKK